MIKDESKIDEILEALDKLSRAKVEIGIIGESGKHVDTTLTVLDIATIHEFGYEGMPERSFIRATFDNHKNELEKIIDEGFTKVMKLEMSPEALMDNIGQWGRDKTVEYLTKLKNPPLSPQTIKMKGSSNLLIDTGQLRDSITYEVVM